VQGYSAGPEAGPEAHGASADGGGGSSAGTPRSAKSLGRSETSTAATSPLPSLLRSRGGRAAKSPTRSEAPKTSDATALGHDGAVSAPAPLAEASRQPHRFRIALQRRSLDEPLGLDAAPVVDLGEVGRFLVVTSVDPEGIADRTGMFRPGDIIRRVNGAEGYQRMAMECATCFDLDIEVLRLREGADAASVLGASWLRVPPLRLPNRKAPARRRVAR